MIVFFSICSLIGVEEFIRFVSDVDNVKPNAFCQELLRLSMSKQDPRVAKESLQELKLYIRNSQNIVWATNVNQQDAVEFFDFVLDTLGMLT